MAPKDRQRAAARARLQREMAERAAAAQKRRRTQTIVAAGVAALVLLAGIIWLITALAGGDGKTNANATPAPAACKWNSLKPSPEAPDPSATASPSPSPLPTEIKDVGMPPETGEPREGIEVMTLNTDKGVIKINLDLPRAPCTAASFKYLASKKFFDGTRCHRVTTEGIYILQCGDPSASGRGGPAYQFGVENLPTGQRPAYLKGQVAMANAGSPDSNGSQFFIVYGDSDLGPNYSIIGNVVTGLDLVENVARAGVDTTKKDAQPSDGYPKSTLTFKTVTVSDPMPSPPPPSPSYPTDVPSTAASSASASASASKS